MDHQSKNKNQVGISIISGRGSGGIAGLLVFGGALAVTGLIAVASFASNKKKNHTNDNKANTPKSPVVEPEPQESQDSTTNDENARHSSFETSNKSVDQVDSFKLLSTPALVLEEELDPKVNQEIVTGLHQEIALSDDNSPPESAVSSNDNIMAAEQCLESSFDIPRFKPEFLDKSESQEPLKSIAIEEGQYEDATTETEDEEDDDVGIETSENSSEATGRTSMDADEAAVWPAELIEEPKRQVNEEKLNIQSEADAIVKPNIGVSDNDDGSDKDMLSELSSYEKGNLSVPMNHLLSESRPSKSRTWTFPMVLLVLALLFCFWYCAPIAFKSLFMF